MTRILQVTFLILALFLPLRSAAQGRFQRVENPNVRFTPLVTSAFVKPGGTGELQLRLEPNKGIHVNVIPPLSVALDSSTPFRISGKPVAAKHDTLLDASKPILQKFTVARGAAEGEARLTGTLIYFYCSETDGWCSRFKQPFDIPVRIRR